MADTTATTIRFVLNGAPVEVAGIAPTTTLLEWLRYNKRLTGTKEGCAEGDCGACTVAVREIAPDGRLETRPINACIALVPMLHGREVITVEHLAASGELHPIQRAMVEQHGSQCGFCTPGFVMSLWTMRATEPTPPSPERVDDVLAGNLCRCTGYGPIVAAARAAFDEPRPGEETADEAAVAGRLADLGPDRLLDYAHDGRRFIGPVTLDDLAETITAHPEATILSGATDVGLWVTKKAFDPETIIYTGRCTELDRIERTEREIVIGAGVRHEDARTALADIWPDIAELLRRFGGTQVRSAGTVGGNIANGSPIGDWPPALIAAGATLVLRNGKARRTLALEDFFIAYGRQDRAAGEFVEAARVPLPGENAVFRAYKVSKRFDSDITAVLACLSLEITDGRIASARIAFGGMAPTPARARAAEAAFIGLAPDAAAFAAAAEALATDFAPITDMRASAGYRMAVARNLMIRAGIEIAAPATWTRLAGPLADVA